MIDEESSVDTSYDLSDCEYVNNIHDEAIECMDYFFVDKKFWAGGAISKIKLYQEEHIKVVMEMSVMDALALSYYCLKKNPPDTINTNKKNWDMDLCHNCLKNCAKRMVPKCFAGGMLLVYLSMCHGVEFIPTLKKLHQIRAALARKEKKMRLMDLEKHE